MRQRREAKVLVFDADDTLWENNALFERVIDDFLAWLDHPTLDRVQIRAVLDDIRARWGPVPVYHLGDLVGYAPWPNETVALLRDLAIASLSR